MYKILERDPALLPYEKDINLRMERYEARRKSLLSEFSTLNDFANAHEYFGFHHSGDKWIYREWAPAADGMYLTGEFNNWDWTANPMQAGENGTWTIELPDSVLKEGTMVKAIVKNGLRLSEHLPLYARRVEQDVSTRTWSCAVWDPQEPFAWTDAGYKHTGPLLIYEAHVGMATEEYRPGTYREFADTVLPRVKKLGYTAVQLMAIMEHPYYGSFGYQVSNFFAASSRFGTSEDLKYLVNKAHSLGITVLLDLVHSHAVKNTLEGINEFDGTATQFFHEGAKGDHPAWGTKCFDYGKNQVLHFLLSNLKFWLTEFHFDGFRFDGVTSMLYLDHALGTAFTSLDMYFSMNADIEAINYLQLANDLIREVNPNAITIAEDMSGMPGMCIPVADGGIGFDYRLGMGIPDMWIKLVKEKRDEDWNLGSIWGELTNRLVKTVGYVESHDQALVGDQTMMWRLAGAAMYTDMDKTCHTLVIDRAVALHKMLRLLTLAAGGDAYLNFMGNEFGHPEWIDFPREGNGWSHHYCRRQWSLVENGYLKYEWLDNFDRDMIHMVKDAHVMDKAYPDLKWIHESDHVIAFERNGVLFVFNFDPSRAYENYAIPVSHSCDYEVIFSSDDWCYGGDGRIAHSTCSAFFPGLAGNNVSLYLPPRTVSVLKPLAPVVEEVKAPEQPAAEEKPAAKKPSAAKKPAAKKSTAKKAAAAEAAPAEKQKKTTRAKKTAEAAEAAPAEKPKKTTRRKKAEPTEA